MPADPYVRQLGAITDVHGIPLPVGVDYCCVTIGNCTLSSGLVEEFYRLLSAACWQAAGQEREAADQAVYDEAERVMSLGGDDD